MKYSLTNKKQYLLKTLFQVKAEMSFGNIAKGDLGGWIEKEDNLSQDGDAWVFGNAKVSGDAEVFGNAKVSGDAEVFGNAKVFGNARVGGDARVFGNAEVFGDAKVSGDAKVFGDAWVFGKLRLEGGLFFGWKRKSEEIKTVAIDDEYDLVYTGEAKFGEPELEGEDGFNVKKTR